MRGGKGLFCIVCWSILAIIICYMNTFFLLRTRTCATCTTLLYKQSASQRYREVADIQVLHDHNRLFEVWGCCSARQPRVHHCRYPHTPRRYGAKAVGDARYGFSLVKLGEDLGVDNDNFESFMEVEETDGMSVEERKCYTHRKSTSMSIFICRSLRIGEFSCNTPCPRKNCLF